MNNFEFSIAMLAMLIVGVSTAGAFPGQTSACDSCHTLSQSIIVTTNVTSTLMVNPIQDFAIGITYSGGLSTGKTEVNWPNVLNNTLFNPTLRVPVPADAAMNGTTSSVLTAPASPGLYNVRVYASSGSAAGSNGTNFSDISVIVQQPGVMSWHVLAGGETTDMKLQGMGFYPGVITINAGDSINWTIGGSEPHTVSFLSGASIPEPGSPETLLPVGGFNYNGTGHVSSGLIIPGMNYTLNFTEPGVYIYQCLLHPGMGGVVIVQPNGSSYPFTQDQYATQGMKELKADLDVGQHLVDNLSMISSPGPNSTTIWQAAADIPLPMNADVVLSQENNSEANGSTALNFIGPGMLEVQVKLSGLAPNSVHPAQIHAGTCEAGGPVVYPLNNLTADAEGNVTNTTIINGSPWLAIQRRGWSISVHQGPTMSDAGAAPIACGDVEQNYASYMRFTPDPLTIHTDDMVVWTQMNFMMIHTVTFPVAGLPIPDFILPNFSINPVAAASVGGKIYNGTDFFSSGVLSPEQNYTLTFTNPGTYDYLCLIHDEMGMKGKVIVLPPEGQINLVSDVPNLARITDLNLVNPWGMARSPTSPWWIADNGMGVSTVYNGTGNPFPANNPLAVTVPVHQGGTPPSSPTGIVFNGASDFEVVPGKPARFIFVTEDGTISGWNSSANSTNAILKVDNWPNAIYKGVTIAQKNNASFLYVANFSGGRVDVFDTDFNPVKLATDAFTDTEIPADFAPFNVQNINGKIFVTFAKQDAQKHDNLDGSGLGFVDVYDTSGNLLMSLEHGNWMNAPWGIALAPSDFGSFSDDLLVGNFGSGQIAAFDPEKGKFHAILENTSGRPITIEGLWGLGFGNGANAGPNNTLFFTAGINDETHGLFGTILPISDITKPVINSVTLNNSTPNTGDAVLVTVNATDNVGVINVLANGASLINQGGTIWKGTITALAGNHQVNVSVSDAAGNIAGNNSTSYTSTPPPGLAGNISGMKFNDSNGNGIKDPEESGLANWTIVLKNSTGSIVETMMTDTDGNYTFDGLAEGNYTVEEVIQAGWKQTFPETPGLYNVTLASGENVTGIDFGNNLRPPVQSGVNAMREIQSESLRIGKSTNITVDISSNMSQALSLHEIIPAGWNLTRISDDADAFKSNTDEWIWFNVSPGINKTVIYRLTAPDNASIGAYHINGTISSSSGVIAVVQGDNTITLDIIAFYRRLGSDTNRVETTDVLTAAEDWRNNIVPAGFERAITTQELLALIDEWIRS